MAPCAGCCIILPTCSGGNFFCRTRTKTGGPLCGYSEFCDVSTPPKKYRKLSYYSTVQWDTFWSQDSSCGGFRYHTDGGTVNQWCQYDKLTCAQSGAIFPTCHPSLSCATWPGTDSCNTSSATRTVLSLVGTEICDSCFGFPYDTQGANETSYTLSDEDTPCDALDRGGITYSDWTDWFPAGVGCPPVNCCAAGGATLDGSGNAISYEAQWKIEYTGLPPLTECQASIGMYAGDILMQTVVVSGTSDESGNLTLYGNVLYYCDLPIYALPI